MLQPFPWVILALTPLAGMTAAAAEPGPERQMRKRHLSLSVAPGVHVSASAATVLLFDSPPWPGTSRVRLDLTCQDFMPHERARLAGLSHVGFEDAGGGGP